MVLYVVLRHLSLLKNLVQSYYCLGLDKQAGADHPRMVHRSPKASHRSLISQIQPVNLVLTIVHTKAQCITVTAALSDPSVFMLQAVKCGPGCGPGLHNFLNDHSVTKRKKKGRDKLDLTRERYCWSFSLDTAHFWWLTTVQTHDLIKCPDIPQRPRAGLTGDDQSHGQLTDHLAPRRHPGEWETAGLAEWERGKRW
ncbi:hypothetical protein RRG08_037076 [Elysia crispata]|uniref:Uncharacterized protein n=1 Tax=Elysia crispata TaxID=231223 RepID=A0AAE0ZVY6_9GAST|nr:hypothetical protein RRG08_037076 [Elysia crispata]